MREILSELWELTASFLALIVLIAISVSILVAQVWLLGTIYHWLFT